MSDFRCEWQALHGPRCSHQCNECKDNDTPPEPRMTSERQETEQAFERWYNHAFATRGVDTKHMNDCEDAFEAGRTLALRATPRAGSASKERGFFEWSCGCSLNNGLVTPCATHASPAAAPREHPSPEPYCASCDAREGEPCPHNVIQCARPRRAHLPRAETDETREAVAWGIWHYNGDLVGLKRTKDEAERWCEGSATYGPPRPLYAHPPRAGSEATLTVDAAKANAIAVRLSAFARELGRDHPRYITLLNAILVIEARTAHPPRAGEVMVTDDMLERAYAVMRDQYRDKALISPTAVREALTAALGRPS